MALGKQIAKYRNQAGLTLEELAELSQVEVGTISALENRDSRMSKFAVAIAKGLGLSMEQLLDEQITYQVAKKADLSGFNKQALGIAPLASKLTPMKYGTGWPFSVSYAQVMALTDFERGQVDGFLRALVANREAENLKANYA